jgi:CheY-like chemotaxis protein
MTLIAVVDDDQSLLDLMTDLLSERSWQVLALRDSATAYESLLVAQPDAILLDIRLSGTQSGWDILDRLQAHPATQPIPVILWSGVTGDLDGKQEWLLARGIPVLSKPFEVDDLFGYLDDALAHTPGADIDASEIPA